MLFDAGTESGYADRPNQRRWDDIRHCCGGKSLTAWHRSDRCRAIRWDTVLAQHQSLCIYIVYALRQNSVQALQTGKTCLHVLQ